MKLRPKEINIFSMSALDLFASALGAFMLLTVMALPFFPNTGDSPEVAAEVRQKLEEARNDLAAANQQLEESQNESAALSQELAKVKIPDLDIVIGLDISGSMAAEIAQLKQQISDLASVLDSLAPSVGIGVIAFGDRRFDRPLTVFDIHSTADINAIQRFINGMYTEMGLGGGSNTDLPEAVDMALSRAVDLSWRGISRRRYIILITDNAAYPESVSRAYSQARAFSRSAAPGGAPSATNAQQHVSTVIVGAGPLRGGPEAELFLSGLAEAGQGQFIDSRDGQSILASILLAVVGI